jgi:hypothetical protein
MAVIGGIVAVGIIVLTGGDNRLGEAGRPEPPSES